MKSVMRQINGSSALIVTSVVLVLGWEVIVRALGIRQFLLPPPSAVVVEFSSAMKFFLNETLATLYTTLAGFFLATVLGVLAAIGIVYSRFLEKTLYPLLVAMNAVPKVALAPLFVIWMGTGAQPKIAVAMLIAIFPILIDTVLGLKSIDPEMINMARAGHATRMQTLRFIRFPNALPSIFSGMKVGISFALVGAIVGEFVAGDAGLGHVILVAQGAFDTPRVFVSLLLLGLLGSLLFHGIELLERALIPWHVSQRRPQGSANSHH